MPRLLFLSFLLLFSIYTKSQTTLSNDTVIPQTFDAHYVEAPDSQLILSIDSIIEEYDKVQKIRNTVQAYENQLMKKEMSFDWSSTITLLKGGLLTWSNDKYRNRNALFEHHKSTDLDYIPAATPLAATWIMKAAGIEGRSKTKRLVTSNAIALGLGLGTAKIMKMSVNESRPDAYNNHSMPSGHTTLAFISATILDREYGHYSPWISVGGYATALATQFHRIHQNAHYLNDVIVGAGIGIVATNLAYSITDFIWGEKGINKPYVTKGDILNFSKFLNKPTSFSLYSSSETGYNLIDTDNYTLLDFTEHDIHLRATSSMGTALELSYFINSNWAVESMARLTQTKVQVLDNSVAQPSVYGDNIYQYHLNLGVKYSLPISLEQRMGLRLFAGYRFVPETKFYGIETHKTAIIFPENSNGEIGGGINFDFLSNKKYVSGFSCDYTHTFSSLFTNRWVIGSYFKVLL